MAVLVLVESELYSVCWSLYIVLAMHVVNFAVWTKLVLAMRLFITL